MLTIISNKRSILRTLQSRLYCMPTTDNPSLGLWSNSDYSIDPFTNNFYQWVEKVLIPVDLEIDTSRGRISGVDEMRIREIRKQIYVAANEKPPMYGSYHVNVAYLEAYLESLNMTIDVVHMIKKTFEKRVKALNALGAKQVMELYKQNNRTPLLHE